MTAEHKKELEQRLKLLITEGRADAAEKIRVAREFGDLSENAEYDIAKEDQAKMEAEIVQIEAKLRNAKIIEEKKKGDKADFGSKVQIRNTKTGAAYEYTIVGSSESNPLKGKISNDSPIGKAVMGHKKGEKVVAKLPNGVAEYEILKIG